MNPTHRPLHGPQGDQPGDVLQAGDRTDCCWWRIMPISNGMIGRILTGDELANYFRPLPPCRHEGQPVVPAHGEGEKQDVMESLRLFIISQEVRVEFFRCTGMPFLALNAEYTLRVMRMQLEDMTNGK